MPSPPRSQTFLRLLPFLRRLRFPQLFALTAGLFLLNLFLPDPILLVDELLLGLLTLMLGSLKVAKEPPPAKPPEKNVTPAGQ